MKSDKAVWFMVFSGLMLVLSAIILGTSIVEECIRLNGAYTMQKVLVSEKRKSDSREEAVLTIDDIKRLKKELAVEAVSCSAQSGLVSITAVNGANACPVNLMGIDYMYPLFSSLTFKAGGFITPRQEEEGTRAAVIDEELAWKLFRTSSAEGRTIYIYDIPFTVTGVVKKEETLLHKLTEDGLPDVYIPVSVMLELDDTVRITLLQISTPQANTMDQNVTEVEAALRKLGKDTSAYIIKDYNLKQALMKQKPLLLVFVLGVSAFLYLGAYVRELLEQLCGMISEGCRRDYFSRVLRSSLAELGKILLELLLLLVGVVYILKGISFNLYIPPDSIPDELINISYYWELLKTNISEAIQNKGYVAPRSELIVDTASNLLNLLLCISLTLGLLLLHTGIRELKGRSMDSFRLAALLGLLFLIATAIWAALIYMSGMTCVMDIKSLLVAWTFVFLRTMPIIKRKECDLKDV
jgi:hypothetical protein